MKKYIVHYEQTNSLDIEVEAKNKEDARDKADVILEKKSFEQNVNSCQKGYFDHCYTDEDEE